jgi:hypothetical protein
MAVLSEQILEVAGKRPEGSLLAAKQFLAWARAMRWTRLYGV